MTPPAPAARPLIQLRRVTKVYPMGRRTFQALRGVDLAFYAGEFAAIVGHSGSGKSTILNMITGIDKPTSGDVLVAGRSIAGLSENTLARWRGANVGIVFQFFQLLPTLTALENVMLPMDFLQSHRGRRRATALRLLQHVDMADHAHHLPSELSGGEQQRVAIARALANNPPILIADEPTGNLDSATGTRIFGLLHALSRTGKLVIFVTHDPELAQQATRIITVQDGQVVSDTAGARPASPLEIDQIR